MILVACYTAAAGGAERVLVEFVSALPGEVALACPEGQLAQSARAAGIRVFAVRARSLRLRDSPVRATAALSGHAGELRRLIAALDPAAVVAWGMRPLLALRLADHLAPGITRPPVVFQHNDLLPGPWLGRAVRCSAARAELVVTLSRTIADELGMGEVIHPGIDVGAGSAPPASSTVLVVGALARWKRPDLALEVLALVRRRHPQARLRLLGRPLEGHEDYAAALRDRARAADLADAVEFAGELPDVRGELAGAACLLHCAEREPFGLAILEALAEARPVVVPATAGPAEIADPTCALLYPPGDVRAAATAVERLLSEPALAARLGAAGLARARTQFDRQTSRQRWARTVSAVARRRGPAEVPSFAIVTVTHNSARELTALLRSIDRHLPDPRVVVVDCASTDHTLAVAQGRITVPLAENVGFARACNRGMAEVREPVTVLLNPDVELLDGSLAELAAEALRRDRPDRLLAPLVLNPDGTRQDTVHPRPGSAAELARAVLPPRWVPGHALAPWRAAAPRPVGWAVGCALVGRTDTLRQLGPFDERRFLYGEDLDLGLRAAAAGVPTWFWPSARVVHHRAHASRHAFGGEPFERLASARREVIVRRLGARRAAVDDAAQAVTFATRIAGKRLLGRPNWRERRQLAALWRVRGRWH